MLIADVGTRFGDLSGPPCSVDDVVCDELHNGVAEAVKAASESICSPHQIFFDDDPYHEDADPLGLGLGRG